MAVRGTVVSPFGQRWGRLHAGVDIAAPSGERIAAVGCTGRCYGDHVHFEVRVNGAPVDPMGYI